MASTFFQMRHGLEEWSEFAHRINSKSDYSSCIAIDLGEHLKVSLRGKSGIGKLCSKFGGGGRETAGIDLFQRNDARIDE